MDVISDIACIVGILSLVFMAFAAGFYRGEASTMNKRMDAYAQGKRDGYWDAWQRDPEGVKPPEQTDGITVRLTMPKDLT